MARKDDKKNINAYNTFVLENINNKKSYAWQIGYKNLGLLLLGFCNWIHNEKEKEKLENIFFLARDGYIVRKIYQILYPKEETHYLYLSRRSLCLPAMKNAKNISDILNCLILPPMFTIDVLLSTLEINVKDVIEELKKANISLDEKFTRSTFKENPKICTLLKKLFDRIKKNANEQYENFMTYLSQENFNGKVGIVDIGWHNSIQFSLLDINPNPTIFGYYIGIHNLAKKISEPNQANGYIYSYGNNLDKQYKTFSFVSLIESMFLSHEGTTLGYKKSNDKILPLLAPYEYEKEKESLKIVNDIQEGAIQFIKDYIQSKVSFNLNDNICSYNILRFGSSPSKKDIDLFGSISFENFKTHNIINFNHTSIYYFSHPKVMIEDFYCSGWRVAFLKKLFKIPFPYYYLLKLLCIIFQKEQ